MAEAATQFGVLIHKPLVDEDLSLTSQQRWNGWVYMMKPSEIRNESAQKTIRVHTTFTMRLSWTRTTAATQHINDGVAKRRGYTKLPKVPTIPLGTHTGVLHKRTAESISWAAAESHAGCRRSKRSIAPGVRQIATTWAAQVRRCRIWGSRTRQAKRNVQYTVGDALPFGMCMPRLA